MGAAFAVGVAVAAGAAWAEALPQDSEPNQANDQRDDRSEGAAPTAYDDGAADGDGDRDRDPEPVSDPDPDPESGSETEAEPAPEPEFEPEPERRHQSLTLRSYGPTADSWRTMPPLVNPSMPARSVPRWHIGTILDFGIGLEVGDADDFDREVDRILDEFDELESDAITFADDFPEEDELQDFLNRLRAFETDANDVVADFTDTAYAKVTAQATAPIAPVSFHIRPVGAFTIDAGAFLEARVAVESVGDAFSFNLAGVDPDDVEDIFIDDDGVPAIRIAGEDDPRRVEPTDDAGVAVQGGIVSRVGLGYSREVWSHRAGQLYAGTTINLYHVALVRGGVLFSDDDLSETARDEFEDRKTSFGFGIDLGALWAADHYAVGAVGRNLNAPSFRYPDTSDSAFFQANPQARRNGDNWKMGRQFTLQAAAYTRDRRWVGSGAIDLNAVADTTGDDYQWAAFIGSFEPRSRWIPSPRVGIRHNFVGEKLTYVSAGLSLFRTLHLDVASTLNTARFDGTRYPRGLQADLALGWRF